MRFLIEPETFLISISFAVWSPSIMFFTKLHIIAAFLAMVNLAADWIRPTRAPIDLESFLVAELELESEL